MNSPLSALYSDLGAVKQDQIFKLNLLHYKKKAKNNILFHMLWSKFDSIFHQNNLWIFDLTAICLVRGVTKKQKRSELSYCEEHKIIMGTKPQKQARQD